MERVFADPFDVLPTFEREIIRLRTYQLTLVLYYNENIVREILDKIEIHDRWKSKSDSSFQPRAPKNAKNRLKKSLDAMVSDRAISESERAQIDKVISFRNDVAHRIDHLFSDLEQGRFSGNWVSTEFRKSWKIRDFDHQAVEDMKQIRVILNRIRRTHYACSTLSSRGHLMFSSTEKTLSIEIKRLIKRLKSLSIERKNNMEQLDKEFRIGFQLLKKLQEKKHFSIRFDLGKMTERGQEFCYLLFDKGISDLAIAHIFEMKLRSIRTRRLTWQRLGGLRRQKPEWATIPVVHTPSRFDD